MNRKTKTEEKEVLTSCVRCLLLYFLRSQRKMKLVLFLTDWLTKGKQNMYRSLTFFSLFLAVFCHLSVEGSIMSKHTIFLTNSTDSHFSDDMNLIWDRIFVGNYRSAKPIDILLSKYNITALLNVAWDLDIRL